MSGASGTIHVSELFVYPIKSARGVRLTSAEVGDRGIAHDRRWLVVDDKRLSITQRTFPRMALVEVSVDADGLAIAAPGMQPLRVALPAEGAPPVEVDVWGEPFAARSAGGEAAAWFSDYLGTRAELVHMPDTTVRLVADDLADGGARLSFADTCPLLLISQASLDDLNARLTQPVPMNRFRPNVVVQGCDAFAEDGWRAIAIGDLSFSAPGSCDRCVMVTIDQATAVGGKQPLATLASYRTQQGKVMFGRYLVQRGTGVVRVGDRVSVLA